MADALTNKRALKKVELNGMFCQTMIIWCDCQRVGGWTAGNCFGEEGIELLRGSLEAKGHIEALGSLSDDEDVEHEDEEEEEEEETRDDPRPKTILSAVS